MPAAAGTATAEETPGTTSTSAPAAAQAATSSPPRPNTNGSPPLRRTTRLPARVTGRHRDGDVIGSRDGRRVRSRCRAVVCAYAPDTSCVGIGSNALVHVGCVSAGVHQPRIAHITLGVVPRDPGELAAAGVVPNVFADVR